MTITRGQVAETVERIAEAQQSDGCIPWFPGGHADPWDHVEAAMALDVAGRRPEAERAYGWLQRTQRPDGALGFYYRNGELVDDRLDANHSVYLAAGVWHHFLVSGDRGFLEELWPTVERAVEFALSLQAEGGEILWMRRPDGTSGGYALLTASSCVHLSLRCALAIAAVLGQDRPDWELSLGALAHAIARRPEAFEAKVRFSMDWYYPVLGGVLTGATARARLLERWEAFVVPGRGVRCVSDQPWVTGAETCEAAMAMHLAGLTREADQLFRDVQRLRHPDGSYWTGYNWQVGEHYPAAERTTWTGAAVVLAYDLLEGGGPTGSILRGEGLPTGVGPSSDLVTD
jgi:hypothetical protein